MKKLIVVIGVIVLLMSVSIVRASDVYTQADIVRAFNTERDDSVESNVRTSASKARKDAVVIKMIGDAKMEELFVEVYETAPGEIVVISEVGVFICAKISVLYGYHGMLTMEFVRYPIVARKISIQRHHVTRIDER